MNLDNFNQNMQQIETQFRAGNISFLEPKEEEVQEPIQTDNTSHTGVEKGRHRRMRSVLVKNLDKMARHSKHSYH